MAVFPQGSSKDGKPVAVIGRHGSSVPQGASRQGPTLAAPVIASFVADSASELTLTWLTVSGATGYEVRIKKTSDGAFGSWVDVGLVLTHQFDTLDADTEYQAQVRAYDAVPNYSSASSTATATTDAVPAFTLVGNDYATDADTSATTSGIDTTGATLIVAAVMYTGSAGTATLSDSYGNAWTPLTEEQSPSTIGTDLRVVRLFYALAPTVGPGHTFTGGESASSRVSVMVCAFGGASPVYGAETGNGCRNGVPVATPTTLQPGSLTPGGDGSVLVIGVSCESRTFSIDSGFTILDQASGLSGGGGGTAIALAYKIQTAAAADNPTWTFSAGLGNRGAATRMAAFEIV